MNPTEIEKKRRVAGYSVRELAAAVPMSRDKLGYVLGGLSPEEEERLLSVLGTKKR